MEMKNFLVAFLVLLAIMPNGLADQETVSCVMDDTVAKCVPPPHLPHIDVVFVVDATGSMADEIRTVKTHLTKIIKEVENGQPRPVLRVGVVAYKDHELEEREYVTKKLDLTYNINRALDFISDIEASGGGDLPEAVADGLHVAVNEMKWNDVYVAQNQQVRHYPWTKKLIFLIGDAAPHGEGSTDHSYVQGCPDGHNYRGEVDEAREKGIRIYTVSGSGIDSVGIRIFKEIARKTGGSYTHLNYIRKDVEQYYQEEGFTPAEVRDYVAEARADVDYDQSTNSILTNTLGGFAKASIQAEAEEMGVEYEDEEWIDITDITGDVVAEAEKFDLSEFFRVAFDKIVFWR